jgi:rhodanese-related sulfurtransferase
MIAIDLRSSMEFRKSHIQGSHWSIRSRLATAMAGHQRPVVLIADEPAMAACAAIELEKLGLAASLLDGGIASWRDAALPMESSEKIPADNDCIDFLFFVHDRHEGNKEAARQYLAWEVNLISQLDALELNAFRLPVADTRRP